MSNKTGGSHRKRINPETGHGAAIPDWGSKDLKHSLRSDQAAWILLEDVYGGVRMMITNERNTKMKEIHRIVLLVCLGLCLLFTSAKSQGREFDPSSLSEAGQKAYRSLLTEKVFAIGGVGYSGETSKGELALDLLIEEKDAINAFRQLIRDASSEGALYGLFGLQMLRCECYNDELAKLRSVHFGRENLTPFTTQSGCIVIVANTHDMKTRALNEILATMFTINVDLKNCRRMAKGKKEDFAMCVRGLYK